MGDSTADPIIAFYSDIGADGAGRTFEDVLGFTQDELESCHDYIQWLFPTFEASAVNPAADGWLLLLGDLFGAQATQR